MNTGQLHFAFTFLQTEPQAAAYLLELQNVANVAAFLENAPEHDAVRALLYMLPQKAAPILDRIELQKATRILQAMSISAASAILRVTDEHTRQQVLDALPLRIRTACGVLLNYSPSTIGAWLETNIHMIPADANAGDALLGLRKKSVHSGSNTVYVVSRKRILVGQLSLIELINAQPSAATSLLIKKSGPTLRSRTSVLSAIKNPVWAQSDSAPVINRDGELIGELYHHELRKALSFEQRATGEEKAGLAGELVHAMSGSLLHLFGSLVDEQSDKSRNQ